jgi:glycosyltransferase involved in cell wall biosynthesis
MERLVERGRRVRLLMVGATRGDTVLDRPDYEASVRRRLSAGPLRELVVWTGYLGADAAAGTLAAADVIALPYRGGASLRHGTLMAALAQGRPIVSTSIGAQIAPLPMLRHAENALLVSPDDPAALADALDQVASDPCLRAHLAAGSRRLAAATDWAAIAEQTLALYRRALGAVR